MLWPQTYVKVFLMNFLYLKKKKTKSKLFMICISYDAEHIYQTASIYVDVLSTQKGNTECSGKEATSLVSICTG